jgi:hypothetical protein
MTEFNSYELSRNWFDWCFENPDKINTNHTALYFFIIEHCNRLGWKERFGLPTTMSMDALGIKNYRTYSKAFDNLVEWGFIKLIEKSKNQWSATVIALVKNTKANTKALSKATLKHSQKQSESIASIDKPINLITIEPINILFESFWNLYNKKVGDKNKIESKWNKLKDEERQKIIDTLPTFLNSIPDKQYLPHPETYLNNKRWNDEITINPNTNKKHYYLSSPFGTWDGLLTEDEFKNKTLTNYWTLIKIA